MPKQTAYSYRRFSSKKQELSDSIRRQTAGYESLCARKEWNSSTLTFEDLGLSALRGANFHEGRLGAFLQAVQSGRIKQGSVLVVESLDRISRQQALKALRIVEDIIASGVSIATVTPERIYDQAALDDGFGLIELLVILMRANEESAIKSKRTTDAWQQKRKKARTQPIGGKRPGWIDFKDGKFSLNKGAEAVATILKMSADGNGAPAILKYLHSNKINNPNTGKPKWSLAYVQVLMKSRTVIGEYQPHFAKDGKRVADGPAIENYYPAAVDLPTFLRAQKSKDNRKRNTVGNQGSTINLFAGLMHDPISGSKYILGKKQSGKNARLTPLAVRNMQTKGLSLDYDEVEKAIFLIPKHIYNLETMRPDATNDQQAQNKARIADITHRIGELKKQFKTASTATLSMITEALNDLSAEQERLTATVGEMMVEGVARQSAVDKSEKVYFAMLKAKGEERKKLRLELKSHLANMIRRIDIVAVPLWRYTIGLISIKLADGGNIRVMTHNHLKPTKEAIGKWFLAVQMNVLNQYDPQDFQSWPKEVKEELGLGTTEPIAEAKPKKKAKRKPK